MPSAAGLRNQRAAPTLPPWPSAHATTILQRIAHACDDECRRPQRCKVGQSRKEPSRTLGEVVELAGFDPGDERHQLGSGEGQVAAVRVLGVPDPDGGGGVGHFDAALLAGAEAGLSPGRGHWCLFLMVRMVRIESVGDMATLAR